MCNLFVAHLISSGLFTQPCLHFLTGTPINKGPTVSNRDLSLYRLFRVVQNFGGYNKVTNQMKWRAVYNKMGLPPTTTASNQIKAAYKK